MLLALIRTACKWKKWDTNAEISGTTEPSDVSIVCRDFHIDICVQPEMTFLLLVLRAGIRARDLKYFFLLPFLPPTMYSLYSSQSGLSIKYKSSHTPPSFTLFSGVLFSQDKTRLLTTASRACMNWHQILQLRHTPLFQVPYHPHLSLLTVSKMWASPSFLRVSELPEMVFLVTISMVCSFYSSKFQFSPYFLRKIFLSHFFQSRTLSKVAVLYSSYHSMSLFICLLACIFIG